MSLLHVGVGTSRRRGEQLVSVLALLALSPACEGGSEVEDGGSEVEATTSEDSTDGGALVEPGSIVITEFLTSPFNNADDVTQQQFVEFHNPTNEDIDLQGLSAGPALSGGPGTLKVIDQPLIVPAGGHILVGRSTDPELNNNVPVLWTWWGGGLGTGGGYFTLARADGVIVDEIIYTAPEWPVMSGHSFNLDPTKIDPLLNDDGSNWCAANTHDRSDVMWSPAAANDPCP